MENKQASSSKAAEYSAFRDRWELAVMKETMFTTGQKLTLLRLAKHANRETGLAWPSAASLAEDCSISRSVANEALQKAEGHYVETVQRGTGGQAASKNQTSKRKLRFPDSDTDPKCPAERTVENPSVRKSDPSVRKSDPSVRKSESKCPAGRYLTLERTPEGTLEKEPFNKTPEAGEGQTDVGETVTTEGEVRVSLAGESNQPSTWKSVNESENNCRNGGEADDGDTVTVVDVDAPIFDEAYVNSLTEPSREDEPEPEWDGEPDPSPAAPTSLPPLID